MIGSELFKDMEIFGQNLKDSQETELNISWIMENREDLSINFPNRWLAVDKEAIQIVNLDLFEVVKIMKGRQELNSSIVFYFSNLYEIPIIVKLCNVESSEIIS